MIYLSRESSTDYLENHSQKRYAFIFLLKHSKDGLFLSQAALSPLREFHRLADAPAKLLDPYLTGFLCETISKFNYADLRTFKCITN